MENKAIKILSICLVALFALAVLFFAVGLIVEYKKAPRVIDATLNQFTSDVDVASEYYTPGTQQFSDVLRARIASNKTIAVVTIAQENNVIFAYPLSSPFIVQGTSGQPTVTAASSFVKIKSNEISLGNNNYIITSALYSLQPTVIYSYIRISFLVILAGTLIAGVTLMYLYLSEQKQDNGFDDLATAKRLKNSKLDFPKVDPKSATDSAEEEDFEFSEEDNQDFDEHNLPEGAMDFPPVDDMESTEDFVFPKKNDSIQNTGVMTNESNLSEGTLDFSTSAEEEMNDFNSFASQENFLQSPVQEYVPESTHKEHHSIEVDLTEIVDNKPVVEDFNALEQEIEAFVPEYGNTTAEEQLPTEHFDIDKALQGYEPPSKSSPEPVFENTSFNIEPQEEVIEPAAFNQEQETVVAESVAFISEPQVAVPEPAYFAEPEVVANQTEVFISEPQVVVPEPAYFAEPEVVANQTEVFISEPQVVASEPAYFAEPEVVANQTEVFTSEPQVAVPEPAYFAEPEVAASQTVAFTSEPEVVAESTAFVPEPEVSADQTEASIPEPQVVESVPVNTEPSGLFSPVTGFGWEAYLEERLDSELIRSASSEEDIGLMMIRIQDLDRTDERNKAIYDKLLDFYKFRDLIFEYGTDGFSCIVHSVNVDSALDMAEQVYVALSKILKENGMNNEIGIGISTRSFRLIPGKRIFEEAEQALIRAFTDPETAIVAFRVDPEKYRQFISTYTDEDE